MKKRKVNFWKQDKIFVVNLFISNSCSQKIIFQALISSWFAVFPKMDEVNWKIIRKRGQEGISC